MIVRIHRKYIKAKYVIGNMYVNGVFLCNTLEDPNRDLNKNGKFDAGESKVYGDTCIPFGVYEAELTYSPKFKRVLPLLLNVPDFTGIRIHRGNTTKDTLGCILVGENKKVGELLNSAAYEKKLVSLMEVAKIRKEKIWVEIV